jgi:hypothetical protein
MPESLQATRTRDKVRLQGEFFEEECVGEVEMTPLIEAKGDFYYITILCAVYLRMHLKI